MAKKETNEEKLIKKINDVNEKMKEIKQEPIKKTKVVSKKVTSTNKIEPEVVLDNNKKTNEVTKNEVTNNKVFGIFETIVVVLIFALIFSVIGYFIGNKNQNNKEEDYISISKEIQTFIEEYNNILQNYYGDINKEEIIQAAIKGMLSSLDEYSGFIDDSSNNFNITLEGSYEGLGVEISNDVKGNIIVRKVYDDTPASKSGLKEGDFIIKFNDVDLSEKTSTELVNMISSSKDIKLTIKRNEEIIDFNLKKEKIILKSVNYQMLENNIGYINISIFANNTYEQFEKALSELENQGMKQLIIDVRGNGGGYLSTAEKMLNLFMDASHISYQTETKGKIEKIYSKGTKNKEYPIVILQDGSSASASELLTSSLKENLNAYIVGKTSYGKGTIQKLQTVSGVGEYKFTTSKWLTPNGNWINEIGINPDLEVALTKAYLDNPTMENDDQLKAATKYLKELK